MWVSGQSGTSLTTKRYSGMVPRFLRNKSSEENTLWVSDMGNTDKSRHGSMYNVLGYYILELCLLYDQFAQDLGCGAFSGGWHSVIMESSPKLPVFHAGARVSCSRTE